MALSLFSLTIYTCNSCNKPRHLYINSITLITDTHSQGERIISFSLFPYLSLFSLIFFTFCCLLCLFFSFLIYVVYHYAQCNQLFTSVYVAQYSHPDNSISAFCDTHNPKGSLLTRKYNLFSGFLPFSDKRNKWEKCELFGAKYVTLKKRNRLLFLSQWYCDSLDTECPKSCRVQVSYAGGNLGIVGSHLAKLVSLRPVFLY